MQKAHKFTCSDELSDWLRAEAERQGISVASVIRMTLYRVKRDQASNYPPIATAAS